MLKMMLAGIGAAILYRAQWATRGRCGGFRLYSRLWRAYTQGYKVPRTGHVRRDLWRGVGLREALRELWATLADCWERADVRGHLAAWWEVVTGAVEVGPPIRKDVRRGVLPTFRRGRGI